MSNNKLNEIKARNSLFYNLLNEGNINNLIYFFQNNQDYKINVSSQESISFLLGKNINKKIDLLKYIKNLNIDQISFINSYVYGFKNVKLNNDSDNENNDNRSITDLINEFNTVITYLNLDKKNIFKTKLNMFKNLNIDKNNLFIFEELFDQNEIKNNADELMMIIVKNKKPLLNSYLKNINVNNIYKLYQNSIVHNLCFYNIVDKEEIQSIYNFGYNIHYKNSFDKDVLIQLMEHRKFESLLNFLEIFKDKIDINNKNNGKTLLHKIIIELGRYKNIDLLNVFNYIIKNYTPNLNLKSGEKNRGKTIFEYIDLKVTDKDLNKILKDKILLEISFNSNNNNSNITINNTNKKINKI